MDQRESETAFDEISDCRRLWLSDFDFAAE